MSFPMKHISISIKRRAEDVYVFASNPANLPQWATGLSGSTIMQTGQDWICESPMGQVKVRFTEENKFGVMDHEVTLPSGEVNHNPFRVFKNDDGSEVLFTLFRLPRMSDSDFARDAEFIETDLRTLKHILESSDI